MGRPRLVMLALLSASVVLATPASPARAEGNTLEAYDAIYLSGVRVGFMKTEVEKVADRGTDYVRIQVETNLNLKRDKDTVNIQIRYGTIESLDGQVLRLDTRTLASQQEIRVHGDAIDGKMVLKIANGAQRQQKEIPWGKEVRGPHGVEQSLTRTPMKPGETREVAIFIPDLNKVGTVKLAARTVESVPLGGGVKRDLLRVDSDTYDQGTVVPGMSTTYWADESGQIMKTFTDVFGGMETFRTTKAAATRALGNTARLDINAQQVLKVARKINNPESSKEVVYKIQMRGDDPLKVFASDARQVLTRGEAESAMMVVKSLGIEDGEPGPETVAEEYLRSNPLVTSDDAKVLSLARDATRDKPDSWSKAKAITTWVARNLRDKNFETSFAPADEVARTLSGDCTEHAVLVAAMCRAVGIPSRVATGMVYVEKLGGFGFHMWNEVYINRRWVAIDAAFDQAPVDAVHVKLSDSSLDGVAPFETFLSVVRVFGKASIEPVEVR